MSDTAAKIADLLVKPVWTDEDIQESRNLVHQLNRESEGRRK